MTSPVHEAILTIDCQGEQLTGVLSTPQADQAETGVLVVVGGPQYRIGSHRQFVLLARRLAASGYDCLRFDVRGMGDSGGAWHSFEQLDADIDAALDALCAARPMLRRVVLWGLCDGASAALLKLQVAPDARIAGLVLVNPWVRSALGLARTQLKHYYLQRLLQRSFWRKLLSGQVAGTAFSELLRSARLAWQASGGDIGGRPQALPAAYVGRAGALSWAGLDPALHGRFHGQRVHRTWSFRSHLAGPVDTIASRPADAARGGPHLLQFA
jgi:exosortase A-associated hydrolase 1